MTILIWSRLRVGMFNKMNTMHLKSKDVLLDIMKLSELQKKSADLLLRSQVIPSTVFFQLPRRRVALYRPSLSLALHLRARI